MSFPISAALLDAIVLSVVAQEPEGTYGYKITQQVTHTLELSESTLYPVLRRLQKDQLLTTSLKIMCRSFAMRMQRNA